MTHDLEHTQQTSQTQRQVNVTCDIAAIVKYKKKSENHQRQQQEQQEQQEQQ